jgi:putative methyltransferase
MSLYFDAVAILTAPSSGGSFKSRIYSARNLRATPAQIYALTTEAAKWDSVLAEVIDKAGILALERKVRWIARRPLRYLLTDQVISL